MHDKYCYKCKNWIFNGNKLIGMGYCSIRKMTYRRWCQSCPKDFELNDGDLKFIPTEKHPDVYKGSTRNND